MSRGPGRAQRELLAVTEGGLIATTKSILLARTPEPTHSDMVTISAATRVLAEKGRIQAFYQQACRTCGAPERFARVHGCSYIRPMLSVGPAGTPITCAVRPHRGVIPGWISLAAPLPPALQGGQQAGDVQALADLIIAKGWRDLKSGKMRITPTLLMDAMTLDVKLAAARNPQAEELQAFIAILLSQVHRHAGRQAQADIQAAVREQYEAFLSARAQQGPRRRRAA